MRLLWFSPSFHPRLGGLETVVQVLAGEWQRLGHEVSVMTETPFDQAEPFPFQVLRQLSFWQKVRAYRRADAVILANVSLWGLLPLLLCGSQCPAWIATHHIWYENPGHPVKLLDRLKKRLARYARANISVSHAVDQFLGLHGHVIPNPYDHRLFRLLPDVKRNRDLVFLGRLVSDKGCDLLLDALALLREQGVTPNLSIIGSGPDRQALEDQVDRLQLSTQVRFIGPQSGEALVQLLNEHRIMAVPSRWNEPFGVVALEGIACGCVILGSNGGGLPEAIGPCGATFSNSDVSELAAVLQEYLEEGRPPVQQPALIAAHLHRHEASVVAQAYIHVFTEAVAS